MMKRELGRFEQAMIMSNEYAPFNVVGVLCLERLPEPGVMEKALSFLMQRHPLLRARVSSKNTSELTVFPRQAPPIRFMTRTRQDQWRDVAEEEINQTIDMEKGPLWRVTVLEDDSSGDIIFTSQHLIVDGVSLCALLNQWLELCGQPQDQWRAMEQNLVEPYDQRLPNQLRGPRLWLHGLAFMMRQGFAEMRYRLSAPKDRIAPGQPRCRLHTTTLNERETTRLAARCRTEGVTLHAALHTAMLDRVHHIRYEGVKTILRSISFTDLRPWLKPAAPAHELGCHLSMTPVTCSFGDASFWDRARQIGTSMYRSHKRGDKFLAPLFSKPMMRMLFKKESMRMGATALSYTGHTPKFQSRFPVTEIHGFVSNMKLGPELTASARIHRGQLVWDYLYLESDMDLAQAKQLANEINQCLIKSLNHNPQPGKLERPVAEVAIT